MLQPLVKSGTIQFSRKHAALLEQMKYFPKGQFDDGLDALEMAVKISYEDPDEGPRILSTDRPFGFSTEEDYLDIPEY